MLNTPAVMRHLGGPKELHEIEARLARAMALYAQEGFSFLMAIEKETGELVGHCGMKRVDAEGAKNPGDLEIGWLVREDRWRRGYAREAVAAVIDWAFIQHGAAHVVALTSLANEPSWRLMEKLGMRRREDLDFDDPRFAPEDNPTILYSLTREEWCARP
ncbi:GNAT family N-acetyltransferase [Erythrobacter sp. QSSC1-22B]|uniref:GNAT family N-acetyltransferase n=1 Tax=Erythrobacter sp. QSSC1-22B TaxID=1860125 RepID=UPI000AC38A1F|nr:GNAT family N-acetyltransferase [Erythrobacter sp. QSSC1-22B]